MVPVIDETCLKLFGSNNGNVENHKQPTDVDTDGALDNRSPNAYFVEFSCPTCLKRRISDQSN